MSRRVSLPKADDLFRPTASPEPAESAAPGQPATDQRGGSDGDADRGRRGRRPSGRVRHDEKMTVYVTAEELLDLEHARLLLRRDHNLAVDRGRLVREVVAWALADLDARGEDSVIVQRLKQA
ncbi:hypothetical protein [Nocardioides pakistanensis]